MQQPFSKYDAIDQIIGELLRDEVVTADLAAELRARGIHPTFLDAEDAEALLIQARKAATARAVRVVSLVHGVVLVAAFAGTAIAAGVL